MSTAGESQGQAQAASTTIDAPGLLDQILAATKPQTDQEADRNKDYFKQFLGSLVQPGQVISRDVESSIKYWIGEIDKKLSSQLNEVMHAPEFQKLEGTWRGLHYLVHQSETGENLKIRVLNVSKKDLFKDLERAAEFDQSIAVQADLRGRIRPAWRQALRHARGRLRVRPLRRGRLALEDDLQRGRLPRTPRLWPTPAPRCSTWTRIPSWPRPAT